jgi:hypothetical protein
MHVSKDSMWRGIWKILQKFLGTKPALSKMMAYVWHWHRHRHRTAVHPSASFFRSAMRADLLMFYSSRCMLSRFRFSQSVREGGVQSNQGRKLMAASLLRACLKNGRAACQKAIAAIVRRRRGTCWKADDVAVSVCDLLNQVHTRYVACWIVGVILLLLILK